MNPTDRFEDEPLLFSLDDGSRLRDDICRRLEVESADHEEREFEDGEHKIRPLQSVRDRDVYVVQSLYSDGGRSVNDRLVRMSFLLGALRDAGAGRVTAVAPYLAYSRKDMRTKPRDPVSTRYLASMFEAVGIDRMVTVDVHNRAAYQNAYRVPTVHLTAAPVFADRLAGRLDGRDLTVVSPDAGGAKRAERFRQILEDRIGRPVGSAFVEKYRSEGVVSGGRLVGDVEGKVAVILDDLISSGTTLDRAGAACREGGARRAVAAATHGVFSEKTSEVLESSALDEVLVLDTLPPGRAGIDAEEGGVEFVESAPLLARAVEALCGRGSITDLEGR